MPRRDLVDHLAPEPARGEHVGLVDAGQVPAAAGGKLEGELDDPLDLRARVAQRVDHGLDAVVPSSGPADGRSRGRRSARAGSGCRRRRGPPDAAARPHRARRARVTGRRFANSSSADRRPSSASSGRVGADGSSQRRAADGAEQHRVGRAAGVQGGRRQRPRPSRRWPRRRPSCSSQLTSNPNRSAGGLDAASRDVADLGPDAVAGQVGDAVLPHGWLPAGVGTGSPPPRRWRAASTASAATGCSAISLFTAAR